MGPQELVRKGNLFVSKADGCRLLSISKVYLKLIESVLIIKGSKM